MKFFSRSADILKVRRIIAGSSSETKEKNFIITNWSDSNAVDGLNEATITFRVSAADVANNG